MKATLQAQTSSISSNREKNVFVLASLQAPETPMSPAQKREPVNIVAVIDISKSMDDGKLNLVKASLLFILDHLSETDTLGVVTFGCTAEAVFPLTEMNETGKVQAKNALRTMHPKGATNLSGGLLGGIRMIQKSLKRSPKPVRPHTLMVFTDGEANRGICERSELVCALSSYMGEQRDLYRLLSFGYGDDHDPEMLKSIVETAGSGAYTYVRDHECIGPCFAECLGGLLSLVAQNIHVEFHACEGVVIRKWWHGEAHQVLPVPQERILVNIGDMYSEQRKDILLCVDVAEATPLPKDDIELVKCTLSYYHLVPREQVEEVLSLRILRRDVWETPVLDPEVCKQRHRILTAEAMQKALSVAETNLGVARRILLETIEQIRTETLEGDTLSPVLLQDLHECLKNMDSYDRYARYGRAELYTLGSSHANQRSTIYSTTLQNSLIEEMMKSEVYKNECDSEESDSSSEEMPLSPRVRSVLSHSCRV